MTYTRVYRVKIHHIHPTERIMVLIKDLLKGIWDLQSKIDRVQIIENPNDEFKLEILG